MREQEEREAQKAAKAEQAAADKAAIDQHAAEAKSAKEAEKADKEATKEAEKAQSVPTFSVSAVEAPAGHSELSLAETKVAAKQRRLEKAATDRKAT